MPTPDIFISYARADADTAKRFAEAFRAERLDVWWDNALQAGEVFDEKIEQALRAAKAVVVLWSPAAVASRWVRAEATIGDRNKTLVPVLIAPCNLPIVFELTQTPDLSRWTGNRSDAVWQQFLADVCRLVGTERTAVETDSAHKDQFSGIGRLSVVVLPFLNIGGDHEQEYFADGITEDLITDLSKVSALGVVARNTAFTFKGKHVDVQDVARQLNVTHVLEGSVRKSGERVRVTAQLIDCSTGNHVWAERYDRNLTDTFELQDELSHAIVAALKVKLLPEEKEAIEERATTSIAAYDLYMRARSLANAARDPQDFYASAELYRQALEIDPDFSPALSGIAVMYYLVIQLDPKRRLDNLSELQRLCDQAAAHAPDAWGAQVLLATKWIIDRKWAEALDAFEQATALAPSFDTDVAVVYAVCLMDTGRAEDAIRALEAARNVDPLSASVSVILQCAYLAAGQVEASHAEYERTYDLAGNREDAEHVALYRARLGGDMDTIKAQFRHFLGAQVITTPYMAEYLEVIDQPEKVSAILRGAFEDSENDDLTRMPLLGLHAAMNGEPELALTAMCRGAVDLGFPASFIIWFPIFEDVRRLEGFKQLIRDLNLHHYWRQSGNWGDFARPLGDDDFEIIG